MRFLDELTPLLTEALPRFIGALLLLLVGLLVARMIARLIGRLLEAAGVDRHAERLRVHDVLERIGFGRSLANAIELALRLTLSLVVIVAALALLGLAALEQSLNEVVLFLPRLIAAMAIILVGLVLGGFAREWVERLVGQMGLPESLPLLAEGGVIAVFVITALAQIGVPTSVLGALAGLVAGAAALTFALAFGLGSRDVARQASAGRYVSGAFRVGQRIAVGDISGEILAIETASTVLGTDAGQTVRVPNHVLLESIVTVDGGRPRAPASVQEPARE